MKRVLAKLKRIPTTAKVVFTLGAVVALVVVGWWVWGLPGTIAGLLLSALGLSRTGGDGGLGAVDYARREARRAADDAAAARVAAEREARVRLGEAERVAGETASADASRLSDRDVLDRLTSPRRRDSDR